MSTIPSDDVQKKRLDTLLSYDLMDTPAEPQYDHIVKLASIVTETPISLISLIDSTRVWCKSRIGLDFKEGPRNLSFCKYTILKPEILEIKDATKEELVRENPYVTGFPHVRFYAGIPLTTPSGYNIGTLCVIDTKPRELSEDQKLALQALASQIIVNMELRLKNKQLDRASKAKDEFLSNMSHEIRTPMNAIAGFTDLLLKTKLTEEQESMLRIIKSSTESLITIVNDILDYSKIESGKLTLENEIFDLKECFNLIYELLKLKSNEKGLGFELIYRGDMPKYVMGDKVRLSQILTNLIGNAIKFTKKGFVKLIVELVKNDYEIGELKFSVIDTGIGIDKDKINKIFERFEQAETSTTRKYGGTGLGLSISKNLVSLYGGELNVESIIGKGSNFNFTIKFKIPSKDELKWLGTKNSSDKINENESDLNGKNILLVEDTDVNVKLVRSVLQNQNINLDVAENGKICIDKLKNNNYDIILMDLQMPVMCGLETTEYIRKELALGIPIIALTANACQKEKQRCLSIGMNDYLTKPFKSKELILAISSHINKFDKNGISETNKNIDENKNRKLSCKNSLNYFIEKISITSTRKCKSNDKNELNKFTKFKNLFESINCEGNAGFEPVDVNSFKEYCDGDEILQECLVKQYLKDFPRYLRLLRGNILAKNFTAIKGISHKMKSSVALFGMEETRKLLSNIERYALSKDIDSVISVFKLCVKSLEQSICYLTKMSG
jgi:signal transduction histidine kinase/DNA-binding response OmpR family regulator